jgi:hypothetical protein
MTPWERAQMRARFEYRERTEHATNAMLYAQQTSAKARKTAREIRPSQPKGWSPDDLARIVGLLREAEENIATAREHLDRLGARS